jgi:hypothetical protein
VIRDQVGEGAGPYVLLKGTPEWASLPLAPAGDLPELRVLAAIFSWLPLLLLLSLFLSPILFLSPSLSLLLSLPTFSLSLLLSFLHLFFSYIQV